MSSLNAIPGYSALDAQVQAAQAQSEQLLAQRNAAQASGNTAAAQSYNTQYQEALGRAMDLSAQRTDLVLASEDTNLASPTVTTGQSQATSQDDAPGQAPTSGGVGAGTSSNSFNSVGADNNPGASTAGTQQALAVFSASGNERIVTQPNQLDQYASYTYNIGWYLLSPAQFNAMAKAQRANITGWQLLMQSGGAPTAGRSPAFSVDYYMDDLEITSKIWGGGKNAANNAVDIKFRVTEPNGITLIESLFNAVKSVYGAVPNTSGTADAPNYLTAQYCLVIQFYGYDSDGKMVAPAKGQYTTTSGSVNGGYGQQAVITKYYPFTLTDIKFQIANKAIEYAISGKPIPMKYNSSTDRGTVPHDFVMTGQTVNQLLNGKPVTVKNTSTPGERVTEPAPVVPPTLSSIATGQDNPLATAGGMDFTPGNF